MRVPGVVAEPGRPEVELVDQPVVGERQLLAGAREVHLRGRVADVDREDRVSLARLPRTLLLEEAPPGGVDLLPGRLELVGAERVLLLLALVAGVDVPGDELR